MFASYCRAPPGWPKTEQRGALCWGWRIGDPETEDIGRFDPSGGPRWLQPVISRSVDVRSVFLEGASAFLEGRLRDGHEDLLGGTASASFDHAAPVRPAIGTNGSCARDWRQWSWRPRCGRKRGDLRGASCNSVEADLRRARLRALGGRHCDPRGCARGAARGSARAGARVKDSRSKRNLTEFETICLRCAFAFDVRLLVV